MFDKDAVSAGVSPVGGLFSIAEIRILICYILSSINEPVPANLLCNTLHFEGIANCFEVSDAIVYLHENGMLLLVDEENDGYTASALGTKTAKTLENTLSLYVRDKAYNVTLKMLSRFQKMKETDYKITKENGRMFLTCTAYDKEQEFFSVKLMVANEEQAEYIKEKFLTNTDDIYAQLYRMITQK